MFFLNIKKNNYKFLKKKIIIYILKKFLFKKIDVNIILLNILNFHLVNKKYNNSYNELTDFISIYYYRICTIYICPLIVEKKSYILKKDLFFYYIYILIHSILHCQGFKHKKYFSKKNIMNKLELKFFLKLGLKNPYK